MNDNSRLRIENEELRERVRQLEEALCPPLEAPGHLGLSATQARMFSALLARESVSNDALALCVFGPSNGAVAPETIRVHISRLRKKIDPYGYRIRSIHYLGYRLESPADRVTDACVATLRSVSRELSAAQ